MTTVLASSLASDSQSVPRPDGREVTVTPILNTCQDKVAIPASLFVITIMASSGGQGLQKARKELNTLHRSAWPLETLCWGPGIVQLHCSANKGLSY